MPLQSFKRPLPVATALVCGALVALVSMPFFEHIAMRQLVGQQYVDLDRITANAIQLADSTSGHLNLLARQLNLPAQSPECSPALRVKLQSVQLGTPGVRAAVRVSDGRISCSSVDLPLADKPLGIPSSRRRNGVRAWHGLSLPDLPGQTFLLLEQHQLGVLLVPDEQFQFMADAATGLAVYEAGPDGSASYTNALIDPAWLQPLPAGVNYQQQKTADGTLLVRRLSRSGQTIMLASRSKTLAAARARAVRDQLLPLSMLLGVGTFLLVVLMWRPGTSSQRELQRALAGEALFLVYQPVIDLQRGQCIAAEVLMRWRQSDGSIIGPDFFIPLAEQLGMSHLLTERVCQVLERDLPPLLAVHPYFRIGINVSAQELRTDLIVDRLTQLREHLRMVPGQLVVEVTESNMVDTERALPVISRLRECGFTVAIDDFGTGYCSLSYLATYPFDILKIDRSFVNAAGTDSVIGPIAEHIVTLARSMGVQSLAEGVETAAQAETFRQLGVTYAQGYHYGAPMSMEQLQLLLEDNDRGRF
jgi:sensor c-di-GMP phosphodiesterase-like protein